MENPSTGVILKVIEWNPLTRPYFNGLEERIKAADPAQRVHEFKLDDLTPKGAVIRQLLEFSLRRLFGRVQQTRRSANA